MVFNKIVLCFLFYLSCSCILCMHGGVQHILCFICLPLVSCVCMVVSNTYCVLFVFVLCLVYVWWCPTHIVFSLSSSCVLCTQCCQFLRIVHSWLPSSVSLAFIYILTVCSGVQVTWHTHIWHVLKVCAPLPVPGMEGLECKNWGEM